MLESRVRFPTVLLLNNNLRQVVHTRASVYQAVQSGTGQWAVTTCGWEGNRGSAARCARVY